MKLIDADDLIYHAVKINGRYYYPVEDVNRAKVFAQEPRAHGHWIWLTDMGDKYIKCSNCGAESGFDEDIDRVYGSYCKFCGARMDEEGEEE